MDLQQERYISRLVVLFLKGELKETEQKELEIWRKASESHEEIFQRMRSAAYLDESFRRFVKSKDEQEKEWQLIRGRTCRKKRTIYTLFRRYAALWFLPLLLAGGILYVLQIDKTRSTIPADTAFQPGRPYAILELADGTRVNLQEETPAGDAAQNWKVSHDSLKYQVAADIVKEEYHTLQVPRGGEYTLVLSDGTRVFLNAESKLKYPVNFMGNTRKVVLEGEAYFEVHRDTLRPFIVETNQVQVDVLGTSFGIRAYAGEAKVMTTLVTGKVNVRADGKQLTLKPSEQAVFYKKSNSLTLKAVNPELFVAWKDGRLVFDNCPLEQILADLGRWYSFDVFYTNPAAKEIPFSLNIRKHEKFSEVLGLMQETGKIHFDMNKNTVIVK